MKKRLTALLCAAALAAGLCLPAAAEGTPPSVTVSSASAAPGGSCTLTVSGKDFDLMSAITLSLVYDADVLEVTAASPASVMYTTVDTKETGCVKYSGISLNGLSGSNTLLSVAFKVKDDAADGTYPVALLITEAFGGENDQPVEVSTVSGSVTVKKPEAVIPSVTFYSSLSSSSVEAGSDVSLTVYTYSNPRPAAGQFSFTYDSGMFRFKSLELLADADGACSVNAQNEGQAVLAYADSEMLPGGNLMRLTLTALEDVSGKSQIEFKPLSLLTEDGDIMNFNTISASVTVREKQEEITYPAVWLEVPEDLRTDESFIVDLYAEGTAALGAGDFAVSYDPDALVCEEVTTPQAPDGSGVTVIINDSYQGGMIRFSMLCSAGLTEDTRLVSIRLRAKNNEDTETLLTPSVSDPVDADVKPVMLDCRTAQVSVKVPQFSVVFKDWDGSVLSEQSVYYLSPAEAPEAKGRDHTEEVHYVFDGWDKAFDSVTGDMEINAQYESKAHNLSDWTEHDEAQHSAACGGCSYIRYADHGWSSWSYEDATNHERGCPDCGAQEYEPHGWAVGYCEDCESDGFVPELSGGLLTAAAPGFEDTDRFIAAWYSKDGRFLCSEFMAKEQNALSCALAQPERADFVRIFALNEDDLVLRRWKELALTTEV